MHPQTIRQIRKLAEIYWTMNLVTLNYFRLWPCNTDTATYAYNSRLKYVTFSLKKVNLIDFKYIYKSF